VLRGVARIERRGKATPLPLTTDPVRARPFMLAAQTAAEPHGLQAQVSTNVIDVPVRPQGLPYMMTDPGPQPSRTERTANIQIPQPGMRRTTPIRATRTPRRKERSTKM
jgi:hypothetical protein